MTATKDALDGIIHTIEIHSINGAEGAYEFCLETPYPLIKHHGQKDLFNYIIPTSFEFYMRVDDSYPWVETFITTLIDADPGEYYVKYFAQGLLQYVGTILTDQMVLQDSMKPFNFKITCTDGLGLLDKYPFTDSLGVKYSGIPARLNTILLNALLPTGIRDYYADDDPFLATCVNWIETTRSGDMMHEIYINRAAFFGDDEEKFQDAEDDDVEFWRAAIQVDSCREVVEKVCKLFNARIYQQDGYYHFVQIEQMENVSRTKYRYKKSVLTPYTPELLDTIQDGFNIGVDKEYFAKLPGGTTTFFDPLAYVVVEHKLSNTKNLLKEAKFYDKWTPDGTHEILEDQLTDIIEVDNTGEATAKFSTIIESWAFKVDEATLPWWPIHYIVLDVTLKIGSYYYKRKRTILNDADEWNYTDGYWTTTPSTCEIVTTKQRQSQAWFNSLYQKTQSLIEFTTPKIEERGNLTFKIEDQDLISNGKVRHKQTLWAQTGPTFIVSDFTLPDISDFQEEDVNKIIKCHINNEALEYKTTVSDDSHFSVSGNVITLNKTINGVNTILTVTYFEHGPALDSDYDDTAVYRWGYETQDLTLTIDSEDPDKNISDNDYIAYLSENDRSYREHVREETLIGDLTDSDSRYKLGYYNGLSQFVGTDVWQNGGAGSSVPLLQLKVEDMMGLRSERKRLMNGSFIVLPDSFLILFRPELRITYEAVNYVMLSGQWDVVRAQYTGTWFEISKNTTSLTTRNSGKLTSPINFERNPLNDRVVILGGVNLTRLRDRMVPGLVDFIPIVEATDGLAKTGDIISIQNPTTGESQEVTVLEDVQPGDTTIVIDEYIDFDFAGGSLVNVVQRYTGTSWKERFTGNTGTTLTVNNGNFPNENLFTEDQLDARISVTRNGVKQWYASTLSSFDEFNISSQTGVITFQRALVATDKIRVEVDF